MISRTSIHGVLALASLARAPEGAYLSAVSIAREIRSPANYLSKLLQRLAREGLVESVKGSGGGFRLARSPREITLLDVVEPLDRVGRWKSCILGKANCKDSQPCAMHYKWKKVRNDYIRILRNTKISDILNKKNGKLR